MDGRPRPRGAAEIVAVADLSAGEPRGGARRPSPGAPLRAAPRSCSPARRSTSATSARRRSPTARSSRRRPRAASTSCARSRSRRASPTPRRSRAAVRAAGMVFVPCHQYHHSPQWQAVARLLPRIGRVHLVEYEVQRTEANPGNPNWSPAWRTDPRARRRRYPLRPRRAHLLPAALGARRARRGAGHGAHARPRDVRRSRTRPSWCSTSATASREVRLTWAARRRVDPLPVRRGGRASWWATTSAWSSARPHDRGGLLRGRHEPGTPPTRSGTRRSSRLRRPRAPARHLDRRPLDEALYVTRVISRAYESSAQRRALPLDGDDGDLRAVGEPLSAVTRRRLPRGRGAGGPNERDGAAAASGRDGAAARPGPCGPPALGVLGAAGAWAFHDVHWSSLAI